MPAQSRNIVVQGKDVFLRASNGEWFYFDPNVAPLGSGAMGTVYMGRAAQNSHYLVAIKRVTDQYAEIPAIRQRAKLEASMAFRHPNLVEMIGYCEQYPDRGAIFIISNLVQGVTLDRHIEIFNGRTDRVERICRCMLPVLDALDYLHEKGIYHLDIKPSNIMVENGRNIRLMDLGIAITSSVLSSSNGGLLGTAGYAAPEQYVKPGERELAVTASTDIYEMGATLYELLSGHLAYSGNKETLESIAGVPKAVMAFLSKCLGKDRDSRYQSARECRDALLKALQTPAAKEKPKWLLPVLCGLAGAAAIIILLILTQ